MKGERRGGEGRVPAWVGTSLQWALSGGSRKEGGGVHVPVDVVDISFLVN